MQTLTTTTVYRRLVERGFWLLERGFWLLALVAFCAGYSVAHAAAVIAPVVGEIQFITIDTPGDHWSGGTIVVGGEIITLPRNLLIDLPANRLTLDELYEQAPATCLAAQETGLAKGDTCNQTGMGGIVSLTGTRTNGGNIIAGDVFIEKGQESVTGQVTYINYTDGYFRVNGNVGDATTGTMVRLNDPTSRHTVQQGLGCLAGSANCSADPRFMLDSDNYTNNYTTGYPYCIPSTVTRTFVDVLNLGTTVAQASSVGTGDVMCPEINRSDALSPIKPAGGVVAGDARRMAPIQLGDSITADGNFENINGVRFLSAHTSMVSVAMLTDISRLDQPDYVFPAEVFMEAPGFQNQRMRNMFIGFTSVAPADVLIWTIHRDPATNSEHEFPLGSVAGCDAAAGLGSCSGQAIAAGTAWDIFRIRYDVDFGIGARADLDPCVQLQAEPRFGLATPICPNSPILDPKLRFNTDITGMMGVLQPVAHEIMMRTGRKLASQQLGGVPLITLDINGNEATNGEYLYPLGMNLGGLEVAEMSEINLNAFQTPINFSGIPWNMDRRLSPNGCFGACEATPQPLDPFPFEGLAMDPRLQAPPVAGLFSGLPQGVFFDPNLSATPLSRASNRLFSFVDPTLVRASSLGGAMASGNFNGNLTVLPWPPVDPAAQPINVTPEVPLFGAAAANNSPPVPVDDTAATDNRTPVTIAVLANDTDPDGNPLSVTTLSVVSPAGAGTVVKNVANTVTFTPAATFVGTATFTYGVSDGRGGSALGTVTVTVTQAPNRVPVAVNDSAVTGLTTPVSINVLANDSDPDGDPLIVSAVTQSAKGSVVINPGATSVTFTPAPAATGTATFTYQISDGRGGLAAAGVVVNIQGADSIATTQTLYRVGNREWRLSGVGSVNGAVITIHVGTTLSGPVIGTATVVSGRWALRVVGSNVPPDATNTVSLESSAGGTLLAVPVSVQ